MKILCGIFCLLLIVQVDHAKLSDFQAPNVNYWRREKVHRESDGSTVLTMAIKFPPSSCHINKGVIQSGYAPIDCTDLQKQNTKKWNSRLISGVYKIYPAGGAGHKAYCDFTTDGGGWTVFQRRMDGTVGFYRTWKEYKYGFGNLNGEHWLGNQILHEITIHGDYELRVDLTDFEGNRRYARYSSFEIGSEKEGYKLSLGKYNGTAGDSLSLSNDMKFSTRDKDLDVRSGGNCASLDSVFGAWWFKSCFDAHLNGPYSHKSKPPKDWLGLIWYKWKGKSYSLKATTMMIRELQ